jgi:DivIVA domain-containing protein
MTVTWREDEPRLTAAVVEAIGFPRTPWGRRGYDEAAVDRFLDQVRTELVMCANERTGLLKETARLRRRFIDRDGAGEWLADAGEAHAMAVAIVSEAQVTADRYVAAAQEYSARLTQDASEQREVMLAEAERVLADARAQARIAADAALAEPVPDQAAGPLRAARARVAYRDTFNGVYLTHVSLLVDTLQEMLGDWRRKEREAGGGHEPGAAGKLPASSGPNTQNTQNTEITG